MTSKEAFKVLGKNTGHSFKTAGKGIGRGFRVTGRFIKFLPRAFKETGIRANEKKV